MPHILIIKHGALGDVVRTSYFAGALKRKYGNELRLSWMTSEIAEPLIKFNPHIDDIWIEFGPAKRFVFDQIFSLDDELEIVSEVMLLRSKKLTGAYLDAELNRVYTLDSAPWFDMGLLSRFGKSCADRLKKLNTRSHADIFSEIFDVSNVCPEFYRQKDFKVKNTPLSKKEIVGINPYAGGRWKSKELRDDQLELLIKELLRLENFNHKPIKIHLLGAGQDFFRNKAVEKRVNSPRVVVVNTDNGLMSLADAIFELDLLISSDSLALHLAIAQRVPFLAFFAPTSAVEIDTFGLGYKLHSTAEDYCSYSSDADNYSITSERIVNEILIKKLL
jgi:heptosyltransferase II